MCRSPVLPPGYGASDSEAGDRQAPGWIFTVPQPPLSEKAVAPHSSTLAWKIPWTEEPGRLQSMGSL